MSEPLCFELRDIVDLHGEQLARFGGQEGLRDAGLLESALHRPVNQWHYGETSLAALAAAYAFGLAKNHLFIDGNKRIAFQAMMTFIRLNGIAFRPAPAEATAIILALAAGEVSEASLARWIASRVPA